MKKKIKSEFEPSRIQKAKENSQKVKAVRDLCEKIVWVFDMPSNQGELSGPEMCTLIDEISPWQRAVPDNDGMFDKLFLATKVSFGFGYALGQMLDLPDIDITPIKDLLREKKALLYTPHEKKAA